MGKSSKPTSSGHSNIGNKSDLTSNQSYVKTQWESLIAFTDQKDWDKADSLFDEVRKFAKSKNMPFMDLHIFYADHLIKNKESERSLPHLRFLKDVYRELGITEDSFLGIRGVPFFDDYLSILEKYFSSGPETHTNVYLLKDLIGHLDEDGEKAVNELMNRLNL